MDAFERRAHALGQRLEAVGARVAVLSTGPDMYYVSGVDADSEERHLLLFVGPGGEATFVVPALDEAAVREATWVEDVRVWADDEDPRALLGTVAGEWGVDDGQVLVDGGMPARFLLDVQAALPAATVGLAETALGELRIRKDAAEQDALRRAARLADDVSEAVRALGADAVGRTERDLAREIEDRLAAGGGEGVAFETIAAAGPNGAHPHHTCGDREIRAGEPVVLDFGAFVDRYPGDQTRTVVFDGEPPAEFRAAFDAVRDAQAAGVAAVEPGATAAAVDRAAREVIEDRGYGGAFVHRTGHGVGLEIHEPPYVVAGNDRELEPGMVFSVEPGIYLEGEFGVRIEDLVLVTEDGCERLNDSPRGWRPPA